MILGVNGLNNDANLSRLVLKNLYESMNNNLTQFRESDFSAISLTYFVNKIYFSLVIGNTLILPLNVIAILDDKMRIVAR